MRTAHGVEAPASILDTVGAGRSTFGQLVESKDDEETAFETVILNTDAYSNAYARTVSESETVGLPLRPMTSMAMDGRAVPNPIRNAIDAPELTRAVQNLGVTEIRAQCVVNHTIQVNEELMFKSFNYMGSIQKFSKSRYRGKFLPPSDDASCTVLRPYDFDKMWGHFDRDKTEIMFDLRHPLKVRTVGAFNGRGDCYNAYSKDEILTIEVN
jgi:hypothetical protein